MAGVDGRIGGAEGSGSGSRVVRSEVEWFVVKFSSYVIGRCTGGFKGRDLS